MKLNLQEDVQVQLLLPSSQYEMLVVNPDDTILTLKDIIKNKLGIPVAEQHLYFKDDRLQDNITLTLYGLLDGSTIRLMKRKLRWRAHNIKSSTKHRDRDEKEGGIISEISRPESSNVFRRVGQVLVALSKMKTKKNEIVKEPVFVKPQSRLEENRKMEDCRYALTRTDRDQNDMKAITVWFNSLTHFQNVELSVSQRHEVCKAMRLVTIDPGKIIFEQDDVGHDFYVILSGTVSLAVRGFGKVATCAAGSVFGELAVLPFGNKRTATAQADFTLLHLVVFPPCTATRLLLQHVLVGLQEKIAFLNGISYFDSFSKNELLRLAYVSKRHLLLGKKRIMEQNGIAKTLHLLMKGQVTMSRNNIIGGNQNAIMDLIEAPQLFGEEVMTSDHQNVYNTTVSTIVQSVILSISGKDVYQLIGRFPTVLHAIMTAAQLRNEEHLNRLQVAACSEPKLKMKFQVEQKISCPPPKTTLVCKQSSSVAATSNQPRVVSLLTLPCSGLHISVPHSPIGPLHRTDYLSRLGTYHECTNISPRMRRIQVLSKLRTNQEKHQNQVDTKSWSAYPLTHLQLPAMEFQ